MSRFFPTLAFVVITGLIFGLLFRVLVEKQHIGELQQTNEKTMMQLHQQERKVKSSNDTVTHLKDELQKKTNSIETLEKELSAKDSQINQLKAMAPTSDVGGHLAYTGRELTNFQVTWYNYNSGITASGNPPKDGLTIAVDPSVIPLGTWVEICMPDGTKYIRQAQDTGSAVVGRIIDIYARASTEELRQRGRTHRVTVRFLKSIDNFRG